MLVVKAKVRNCSPRGASRTGLEEKHIPGGESKKESLGVSRVQLKVQLGRTTVAGGTVRVPGSAREKGLECQAEAPDLL